MHRISHQNLREPGNFRESVAKLIKIVNNDDDNNLMHITDIICRIYSTVETRTDASSLSMMGKTPPVALTPSGQ